MASEPRLVNATVWELWMISFGYGMLILLLSGYAVLRNAPLAGFFLFMIAPVVSIAGVFLKIQVSSRDFLVKMIKGSLIGVLVGVVLGLFCATFLIYVIGILAASIGITMSLLLSFKEASLSSKPLWIIGGVFGSSISYLVVRYVGILYKDPLLFGFSVGFAGGFSLVVALVTSSSMPEWQKRQRIKNDTGLRS